MNILECLKLPEAKSIKNLDSPSTALLHSKIIQKKPFLKKIYLEFYNQIKNSIGDTDNKVIVELGSGGGFIKEVIPNIVTSDVMAIPNVDKIFSASQMPFKKDSVDAFVMLDVLHHIPEPEDFFAEAQRCLKNKGKIILIEPANTLWSRFVFKNFHHESFDPGGGWNLEEEGPLSAANGAIPWIIFSRDRDIFERKFVNVEITAIKLHTPFRYIISGGLTLKQLLPSFAYSVVGLFEYILTPFNLWLGMFQTIELTKNIESK